jgi:hypothetical protein
MLCLLSSLLCLAPPALAHKASDSYLILEVNGSEVSGQWDIALRDIDFALGLDVDGNGEITWGELRARHADIDAWALGRLGLQRGGACRIRVADHLVDTHTDGAYAVLQLTGACPRADGELSVSYRLLFELDALHRGLLRLDTRRHVAFRRPRPGAREQHFVAGQARAWRSSASIWSKASGTSGSASITSSSCSPCCCPPCWCTRSRRLARRGAFP